MYKVMALDVGTKRIGVALSDFFVNGCKRAFLHSAPTWR